MTVRLVLFMLLLLPLPACNHHGGGAPPCRDRAALLRAPDGSLHGWVGVWTDADDLVIETSSEDVQAATVRTNEGRAIRLDLPDGAIAIAWSDLGLSLAAAFTVEATDGTAVVRIAYATSTGGGSEGNQCTP